MSTTAELRKPRQRVGDRVFAGATFTAGLIILLALAGVAIFLTLEGLPALNAPADKLGGATSLLAYVAPLVFGTLLAAALALLIATPLSIGVALVISHYAPRRLAKPLGYLVDLLAAVPSVVYGLWGLAFLGVHLSPAYEWLDQHLGWIPFFAGPASTTGRTILTASIVLAIMVLPIITAITREIFVQTPTPQPGGRAGAGRHPLGDDPARGVPLRPQRHRLRGDARPRPRARRDDGRRHGALGQRRGDVQPDQQHQPLDDRREHRPEVPRLHRSAVNALIASGLVLFVITFVVNFAARAIVARSEVDG